MTVPVILVDASPRRAADGVAQAVRLAGGGALYPYRYGAADYRAGVVQLPDFFTALPFDGGDFGAGGVPQAAELQWSPASKPDLAAMANLFWIDAPVTVRIGDENAAGTLPPIVLTGKVLAATVDGGVLKIALCDPAADLKRPLLTARYGGTGNLDGPAEWDGKIKRRLWGRVWNIAGELIDAANNIYCWADPAQKLQGFDAVRDKGAPAATLTTVAWQGTQAATLAALRAAAAPQGGGVTCPSIACVKWWTQPAGDLTADVRGEIGTGYVERTADLAARIVAAGPNTAFAAGTVAAASALRTAPVGWVAKDENTSVAAMLEDLLGHSSLLWLLDATGAIVIREWAWGASAASAISQSVKRTDVFRPVATRKIGYARNETPIARGNLAAIVLATDAAYLDGTPLEDLKPAQAGSDKTSTKVAAAIAGQGALATKNAVNLSTADAGVFGSIPLSVPSGGFIYISTTTTITVSWAAFTVYRADLSTIAVSAGSQAITGLTSGTTYRVYPYAVDSGGSTATVAFVTGASAGAPAIAHPAAGSALAAATMNQRGNVPLGRFAIATPATGTGGGSGGGFNCLHPDMKLGGARAATLQEGDLVPSLSGLVPIRKVVRTRCSEWFALFSGAVEIARVTGDHLFYLATGDAVRARNVQLGTLLRTDGDHCEVTGIHLDREPRFLVGIDVGAPHLHFGGPMNLLMHNGTDKP